jgi:3-oxoacyl-[acyl-carrier protein] reductase
MVTELDALSTFSSGLFQGRTALVTGGGRGIGRRTALAFARLGARVVIASRNEQNLEETSAELRKIGAEVLMVPMSIREVDQVEVLIARTIERFGTIDFLVNNAGGQFPAPPGAISDRGWRAVIDLNLKGTLYLTRQVTRSMLSLDWGRIINISSIIGLSGYRGLSVYGATKAGLDGFTRALARELGARNITVNSVAPGYLNTEMTEELDGPQYRQIVKRTPLGRLGDPTDVTGLIRFLCSTEADFITGQVMVVDGGITC